MSSDKGDSSESRAKREGSSCLRPGEEGTHEEMEASSQMTTHQHQSSLRDTTSGFLHDEILLEDAFQQLVGEHLPEEDDHRIWEASLEHDHDHHHPEDDRKLPVSAGPVESQSELAGPILDDDDDDETRHSTLFASLPTHEEAREMLSPFYFQLDQAEFASLAASPRTSVANADTTASAPKEGDVTERQERFDPVHPSSPTSRKRSRRATLKALAAKKGRLQNDENDSREPWPQRPITTPPAAASCETDTKSGPSFFSSYFSPLVGPTQEEWDACKHSRDQEALKSWYQRFNELAAFIRDHGHCNVPQKYPTNKALGTWVNKQREEYKRYQSNWTTSNSNNSADQKTSMTPGKIARLEGLGFTWAKPKGDASWETHYRELVDFHRVHGHANVRTKYRENRPLGRWVSTQRHQWERMEAGEDTPLTQARIDRLNALGFVWRMQRLQAAGSSVGTMDDSDSLTNRGGGGGESSLDESTERTTSSGVTATPRAEKSQRRFSQGGGRRDSRDKEEVADDERKREVVAAATNHVRDTAGRNRNDTAGHDAPYEEEEEEVEAMLDNNNAAAAERARTTSEEEGKEDEDDETVVVIRKYEV